MNKLVMISSLAGAAIASTAFAQNGGFRLTDGTAIYDVSSTGTSGTIPVTEPSSTNTGSQANFRVSGGTSGSDNLYTNWWWYRVNGTSTRELGVRQATGTATRTSSAANQVTYTISPNASESFVLSFTLTQINANMAVVNYSCTVNNLAATARDFSLFNYADYFLANADSGDRLDSAYVGGNGDRVMNLSDSGNAGWGMSHWGYGASAYAVGTFSGVGGQITDTTIDNFSDQNLGAPVNPAAGADITGVMQWNFGSIAAGGSATASGAIIVWNVVPTPGAAALLGAGLVASARRRRA